MGYIAPVLQRQLKRLEMNQQGEWQVAGSAPEVYERELVPAVFAVWAPILVELAKARAGERVLDVALQFFADRAAAVREMHRVLSAEGRLALMVWRGIHESPGFVVLAESLERHIGQPSAAIMRAPFGLSDAD